MNQAPEIALVAAMAANRVIGKDNQMPWHHRADLAHFKRITMGKPIIMGRKTHESIGRVLPGRKNIVITRDLGFKGEEISVANSLSDALSMAKQADAEEIMVIGGAQIYEAFMPHAKTVYLTVINHDFSGDAYFPMLSENEWMEVSRHDFPSDIRNPYPYSFIKLSRTV